jgi:photosystem II stability/assembly factor-like uncharacterized protein
MRAAVQLALAFTLFGVSAGGAGAATNTWNALGPSAAQIVAMAASPDAPGRVYAATEDTVYKSLNSGQSWTTTTAGPAALTEIVADPADADSIVAVGTDCVLWLSSDGGATWTHPLSGFDEPEWCLPHLAWTSSGLFLLANGTLYASADGGANWTVAGSPPEGFQGRALLVLPTTPATIYVGTPQGTVTVSTDLGATWTDRSSGLPTPSEESPYPHEVAGLVADPADSDVLYAELDGVGLYSTSDAGLSWQAVPGPLDSLSPLVAPATLATTPTTLVAYGSSTAYRSTDGGTSWQAASNPASGLGAPSDPFFLSDPSDPDAVYFANFGVYRSQDAGETWGYRGTGLAKAVVNWVEPLFDQPQSYLAATEGVGVQRTDDDGQTWQVTNDGVLGQTLQFAADPSNGEVAFLLAGGHLFKTIDGGAHWNGTDSGIPGAGAVAVDPSAPNVVYTGKNQTVYRSVDGGETWTAGSALPPTLGAIRRLAVDPTNGDRVYVGTSAGLFRSTDSGASWTRLSTIYVYDIVVATDGDAFASLDTAVLRFTPASLVGAPASTGLGDIVQELAPDPTDAETLYAGTIHGVYESVDGGGQWTKLTTAGLDSQLITHIASVAAGHLMAATARGTASIDLVSPTTGSAQADSITTTTAHLGGSANPTGSSANAFFEYGPTQTYGSTTPSTALGSGTDPVDLNANLSGLSAGTTYHYRLVVKSGGGIAVTPDATFVTVAVPPPPVPAPTVFTGSAVDPSASGVAISGTVNPRGSPTSYWFEYGMTTAYGVTTPSASAGSGSSSSGVAADLSGLEPITTYHYRLVAENAGGRTNGGDRQFTTKGIPPPVSDVSVPSLRLGQLVDGAVPLALSWSSAAGTGVFCVYDVHRGWNGVAASQIANVVEPALQTSAQPASGLYHRVRSYNCDGGLSAFADSPAVDLRLVQESSPTLQRSTGWARVAASDASGGHVLRTNVRGARATLTFTGRAVALVVPKGVLYGGVSVGLDGGVATQINLYRAARQARNLVFVVNFGSVGVHKLSLRSVAIGSRTRVDIDAFAVIS